MPRPPPHFTPSELRILPLVKQGRMNKQIAWELSMSISTVKAHIHHMLVKCDCRTRQELVYIQIVDGWNG